MSRIELLFVAILALLVFGFAASFFAEPPCLQWQSATPPGVRGKVLECVQWR